MPPPGPAYGFLCVANSVFRVLSNVAEIRAAQLARNTGAQEAIRTRFEKQTVVNRAEEEEDLASEALILKKRPVVVRKPGQETTHRPGGNAVDVQTQEAAHVEVYTQDIRIPAPTLAAAPVPTPPELPLEVNLERQDVGRIDATTVTGIPSVEKITSTPAPDFPPTMPSHEPLPRFPQVQRKLQSSKVPSSRVGRLFHYGGPSIRIIYVSRLTFYVRTGLAASLGYGAAAELLRRSTHSDDGVYTPWHFTYTALPISTVRQQSYQQLSDAFRRQCQTPCGKTHENARSRPKNRPVPEHTRYKLNTTSVAHSLMPVVCCR